MIEEDQDVAASPPGLRPFGAEPAAQSQAEPLVPNAGFNAIPLQLEDIASQVERWLAWDTEDRRRENLTTDRGTHIMSLPVPVWPTHGQFRAWVKVFREAAQAIETRSGQTEGLDPKGESAVLAEDAPQ